VLAYASTLFRDKLASYLNQSSGMNTDAFAFVTVLLVAGVKLAIFKFPQ